MEIKSSRDNCLVAVLILDTKYLLPMVEFTSP